MGSRTYCHRLSYFLLYVLLSACMFRFKLLELLLLLSHRIFLQFPSQLLSELVLLLKSRPHSFCQLADLLRLHLSQTSTLVYTAMYLAFFLYLSDPYLPVEQVLRLQSLPIIQANQGALLIKYRLITIEVSIILWQRP